MTKEEQLFETAKKGSLEHMQSLLCQDVDINASDDTQWTALHYAAIYEHTACFKYLVDHGANVYAKNNYGATPLHLITDQDHVDCLTYLFQKNIDFDVEDSLWRTPLNYAESKANFEIICMIKDYMKARDEQNEIAGMINVINDYQTLLI